MKRPAAQSWTVQTIPSVPAGFLCASGAAEPPKSTESLQLGLGGLLSHARKKENSPRSPSGLCFWKMHFCGRFNRSGSPALQPLERTA